MVYSLHIRSPVTSTSQFIGAPQAYSSQNAFKIGRFFTHLWARIYVIFVQNKFLGRYFGLFKYDWTLILGSRPLFEVRNGGNVGKIRQFGQKPVLFEVL